MAIVQNLVGLNSKDQSSNTKTFDSEVLSSVN